MVISSTEASESKRPKNASVNKPIRLLGKRSRPSNSCNESDDVDNKNKKKIVKKSVVTGTSRKSRKVSVENCAPGSVLKCSDIDGAILDFLVSSSGIFQSSYDDRKKLLGSQPGNVSLSAENSINTSLAPETSVGVKAFSPSHSSVQFPAEEDRLIATSSTVHPEFFLTSIDRLEELLISGDELSKSYIVSNLLKPLCFSDEVTRSSVTSLDFNKSSGLTKDTIPGVILAHNLSSFSLSSKDSEVLSSELLFDSNSSEISPMSTLIKLLEVMLSLFDLYNY